MAWVGNEFKWFHCGKQMVNVGFRYFVMCFRLLWRLCIYTTSPRKRSNDDVNICVWTLLYHANSGKKYLRTYDQKRHPEVRKYRNRMIDIPSCTWPLKSEFFFFNNYRFNIISSKRFSLRLRGKGITDFYGFYKL